MNIVIGLYIKTVIITDCLRPSDGASIFVKSSFPQGKIDLQTELQATAIYVTLNRGIIICLYIFLHHFLLIPNTWTIYCNNFPLHLLYLVTSMVTTSFGVNLGRVWYLIVLISDLCTLTYFNRLTVARKVNAFISTVASSTMRVLAERSLLIGTYLYS